MSTTSQWKYHEGSMAAAPPCRFQGISAPYRAPVHKPRYRMPSLHIALVGAPEGAAGSGCGTQSDDQTRHYEPNAGSTNSSTLSYAATVVLCNTRLSYSSTLSYGFYSPPAPPNDAIMRYPTPHHIEGANPRTAACAHAALCAMPMQPPSPNKHP